MDEHEQIFQLKKMIRLNKVPGWDEVDWVEVYRGHVERQHRAADRPWPPQRKPRVQTQTIGHRFRARAATANARARKHGAEGIVTPEDLDAVMLRCGDRCVRCATTEHLVFDHIIPYYRGGSNRPDNIQVLCRICNMEKGVNA